MEEAKVTIGIIGNLECVAEMSAAVMRVCHVLDAVCITQLEAKVVEFTCPEVDLPPLPVNCCGPWEIELSPLDAKALADAFAPLIVKNPIPTFAMPTRERGEPQPYRGYANSRRARRRNW